MDIVGDWDVTIKTPVGSLQIVYSFADRDGVITGSAAGRHETVQVTDIVVADDGRQVSWRQTVTRPMRLNLAFDVLVDGDGFTGHSRAGRLPRSAVSGVRRR
ncbi:hypothetical protein O6P37_08490 [Mycobacterium sp. CPCC 205372]|uniref:Uncharacterized protein n=1 Tax=Mycobacterium hippophais TaxID=3016340 RepID=A0ABT4PQY7_9MYCO|nr:hypothetical protein [Mycobacterium hippophais]MCZ8378894.1 hypothetical protein [Mycobacterium hippophais]